MHSRTRAAAVACAAAVTFAGTAGALERASAVLDDATADPWRNCATATIRYYNTCTGWIWILSGFQAADRFGVAFDVGWGHGILCATSHFYWSGAPAGWGFTGTMALHDVDDNDCPVGMPLDTQAHLPTTGWMRHEWGWGVGFDRPRILLLVTLGPGGDPPIHVATDHPAAVAGGPPACGTCYPTTRQNRSWYYGTDVSCPPATLFHDPVCDAQLLWEAEVSFVDPVEPASWARVKSLYR